MENEKSAKIGFVLLIIYIFCVNIDKESVNIDTENANIYQNNPNFSWIIIFRKIQLLYLEIETHLQSLHICNVFLFVRFIPEPMVCCGVSFIARNIWTTKGDMSNT